MQPPETAEGRPTDRAALRKISPAPTVPMTTIVAGAGGIRPWRGCPCGCMSRLPWLDDPDCIRHRPLPQPREWGAYDAAHDLGLACDHGPRCPARRERAA